MKQLVRTLAALGLGLAMGAFAPCQAQSPYTFQVVPFSGTAMSNTGVLDPFGFDPTTFGSIGFVHGFDGSTTTIQIPGWFDTTTTDINNSGTVVGSVDMIDDSFNLTALVGFVRKADGSFLTYLYPGSAYTMFDACNDAGTVIGEQFDTAFNDHQFLLDRGGKIRDIFFPGYESVLWTDLNNAETLLSSQFDPAAGGTVGLLAHGSTVEQFVVPGAASTMPVRINNRGEVAGTYTIQHTSFPFLEQHGFVRDAKGRITTVDFNFPWPATEDVNGTTFSLLGTAGTSLNAINDRGQVIGLTLAIYEFKSAAGQISVEIDVRQFLATPSGG